MPAAPGINTPKVRQCHCRATGSGTVNDARFRISRRGNALSVLFNRRSIGTFDRKALRSINVLGYARDDLLSVDRNVHTPVFFDGGAGDDDVT